MNRMEIVREEGPLRRRVWTFTVLDFPKVILDGYSVQERATKRHKWRALDEGYYARLGRVRSPEPEVPDDVVEDALQAYREMLVFEVWSRRGR